MANELVTREEKRRLSRLPSRTLAKWWRTLNIYEWPKPLDNPEPRGLASGGRRSQLMDEIEMVVGKREILRLTQ